MKKGNKRRKFLRQLALGSAGTLGMVGSLSAKSPLILRANDKMFSPNDMINVGVIGYGIMGQADAETASKVPGVKITAVCDLYSGRLDLARRHWGEETFTTMDYRELIARNDVDAVIIATSDHWHKQISIDALENGKPAYCEKPMVHSVDEGAAVIEAQRKSGLTYQVGSQGMSSLGNAKAKKLLEEGAIGQLVYAEGFWARNSPWGAWQYEIPEDASTETVDWDAFISNTTERKFDPLRFFRWRNYRDYGTGVTGDLFVHLFSSLHFVTGSKGPTKIQATGGLRYWKDGREVPDVMLGMFDYPETDAHPGFNLSLRVNFVDGSRNETYFRLVGSKGSMDVGWREVNLKTYESYDPEAALPGHEDRRSKYKPMSSDQSYEASSDYLGAHYAHLENFFVGVRESKKVTEDAVFGFRAAAPALLCNDSYYSKEIIEWDPDKMKVIG